MKVKSQPCGERKTEIIPATDFEGLAYEVNGYGTCTITGIGTCKDTDFFIPTTIDGYKVTAIGDKAFGGCSGLTSITIPESVVAIGGYAFYNCSSLTSITIPDSVTTIGERAFEGCSGLTSIDFGGTKAQWKGISKGESWNFYTGSYEIHCTDGTISKE